MAGALPSAFSRKALALAVAGIAMFVLVLAAAHRAEAQPRTTAGIDGSARASEQGVRWQDLQPGQRAALKPLERDWAGSNATQKQKWLEIAARFPNLPADEKSRIQARMAEWARLTPEQRGQARVNFQQAKQAAPQDRQSQWDAYQSLSAEEKSKLAARAAPLAAPQGPEAGFKSGLVDRGDRRGHDTQQSKTNIVPNPAFATPPRAVAPTVQQAQPGATTTLISKRPAPPPHQQTGMAKIAATPNFVDKSTLLPQRGPQGAATRSAGASAAEATQRR